jgi:subtilisin family serine protease
MGINKLRFLLAIVLLLVTLVIPAGLTLAESPSEMVDVLVTFHEPPGPDEIELIESLGGSVKKVYHIVPTIAATMPSENLDTLSADPRVKLVELDTAISSCFAGEVLPWGVDRVDAELVHPTNKGTGVKVAILDTGIDLDHPDLAVAGNVTFVSGTTNGDDDNGHGTLVAGIIGALDNDIGVIGVAPEASLYAVKVLDQNGNGLMSIILSGIEWAVDNNMQVINMSFGSSLSWPTSVREALDNAYAAGIVIVAGAGNGGSATGEGNNVWAPARYKPVIAVGATDELDERYEFSSTGYTLELMAPGVNIYSTARGGGYGYLTGTSASSPHVAGVAALLIASGMTSNVDIRYRLRDSAEDLGEPGWDPQFGKGIVNAEQAINFSEPPDQTAPTTTISLSGTMGDYNWYVSEVEVTLNAVDNEGGSGVAETKYSLDGGETWYTYTSPFTITDDGANFLVLARSWDNAGNDEGPPDFITFKIDRTPPLLTETVIPTEIERERKGIMVDVDYSGTAEDLLSGVLTSSINTVLIDEYGVFDQDLGSSLSGTASVEAWCDGSDKDGRTYIFRISARDYAGNQASAEAVVTVLHP